MYIHGDKHENPRKGETSKKVINKGFLRVLEGYEQSDKNTFRVPRQGIPFCLKSFCLWDFRGFRAGNWDTFGTVEDCDIAQNHRCDLPIGEQEDVQSGMIRARAARISTMAVGAFLIGENGDN